MIVDVSWDGVKLATGAQAREEAGGWFVELEQPMPVGTRLTLEGEAQATVRVARVHEGLGAGMLVKAEGAVTHAPKQASKANATPEAKPEAKAEAKPDAPAEPSVVVAADAEKATENGAHANGDDAADEGANGTASGGRRDRRRRRKPTGP